MYVGGKTVDFGLRCFKVGVRGSGKVVGVVMSVCNASSRGDEEEGGERTNSSSSRRRSLSSLHSFKESCIRAFVPVYGCSVLWCSTFRDSFLVNSVRSLRTSKGLKFDSGQYPKPRDKTSISVLVRECDDKLTTMSLGGGGVVILDFCLVICLDGVSEIFWNCALVSVP